ncbi:LOW QUALITY PROTEIN: DCC-interacting protein 13-alpha-like [Haliotis rubra]|uniref:LOW QUALITY PROTEIN: DCC-interacting protein 13-alpha-like n=1 Tax=Haliotis rubra TaxID=36100 RepID=UPI001EE5959E|nr:LOW QUALITY PROTEIN: DCC-interacting protein 13-alpha-like [Haliotis rubra]
MPDIEKLHLEEALEDSPQTRSLLSVFEKDALILKKYTSNLHSCCQRVMSAQNELCAATQALAQQLRTYEVQKFPLESENSILTTTLNQFASYLDDISSVQQVLASQFSETMMYPLSKFLQADMDEISTMFEMFQIASHEHEQALTKYMKLPSKKDNEKARVEVNEELYAMRKKFHQTSLHYYSSLNAVQYKRRCFLLEPIMGYLHAQRSFFQMGQDAVCKPEIENFLTNIAASVQSVHQELSTETQKTVELIDTIEKQSAHLYNAEPPIDMPFIPPNTALTQKAGYLFQRIKQALITTKWERVYFFTQGGNLMSQAKEEFAGSLVIDLNEEGVIAEPGTADDRRFVFQVVSPGNKKACLLQAENYRERDEWIATINNIVKDSGYVRGKATSKKKEQQAVLMKNQSTDSASAPAPEKASPVRANHSQSSTPAATPTDNFVIDTPIQFDLVSPSDENRQVTSPQTGPPKRINPFDQSSVDVLDSPVDNAAFSQSFTVRFLGSMEVKSDRGEQLVHGTMRQILAARAIHNVFKMTESRLLVTNECMRLIDPSNNTIRVEFALPDISFWSVHQDNPRLFGFITRNRSEGGGVTFACHVFESNNSAEEICQAISTATKIAFQAIMEKRSGKKPSVSKEVDKDKEKRLLLENIQRMDDIDSSQPPLSPDGKFLILSSPDQSEVSQMPSDPNPPVAQSCGDGNADLEGAESEA